jgi:hypothetical protein
VNNQTQVVDAGPCSKILDCPGCSKIIGECTKEEVPGSCYDHWLCAEGIDGGRSSGFYVCSWPFHYNYSACPF